MVTRKSTIIGIPLVTALMVAVLVAVSTAASAGIPAKVNCQGRLTDAATGGPLAGSHEATFRLFDGALGGTELWSEDHTVSVDSAGTFAVILGGVTPIDTAFDAPAWLEIEIDGVVLSPRRELVSVPYALRAWGAETADMVGGLRADAFSDTAHVHDGRYRTLTELDAPGAINSASNPVDWTKLKAVPAGFADGIDDVGGVGDGHSLDAADGDPVDAVYVDDDGNVGVGTTAPGGTLHLARSVDGPVGIAIENTHTGSLSSAGVRLIDESGEAGITLLDNNAGLSGDKLQIYNTKANGKIGFVTAGAERITMTEKGHLGIGHSNATYPLQVVDTTSVNYEAAVYVDAAPTVSVPGVVAIYGRTRNDYPSIPGAGVCGDAIATGGAAAGVQGDAYGTSGKGVYGWARHASGVNYGIYGKTSSANGYAGYFEGGQNYFQGRVGIGTPNPAEKLDVDGTARMTGLKLPTGAAAGRVLMSDASGTGAWQPAAGGAQVWNYENTYLRAGTNGTERLRISGDGKVGIGETNPSSLLDLKGSDPYLELNTTNVKTGVQLQKNGALKWELGWNEGSAYVYLWSAVAANTALKIDDATGRVGMPDLDAAYKLNVGGDIQCVSLHETSDARLKTDVQRMAGVLDRLGTIRGVAYRWNEEAGTLGARVGDVGIGVLAQELEGAFPQLVSTSEAGYKSVEYGGLTAVLLEAVKELKAENEALRQRVEALEARR